MIARRTTKAAPVTAVEMIKVTLTVSGGVEKPGGSVGVLDMVVLTGGVPVLI